MKICIVATAYADPQERYQLPFVHARALAYQAQGHEVLVLVPCKNCELHYNLDGVPVYKGSKEYLAQVLKPFNADVLCVHIATRAVIRVVDHIQELYSIPKITWIHGYEAYWNTFRRWFDYFQGSFQLKKFLRYSVFQWFQLRSLRKYLDQGSARGDLVFCVSKFLHRLMQKDTGWKGDVCICPNPIDNHFFTPQNDPSKAKKILIIRPDRERTYSLDLALRIANAIQENVEITLVTPQPQEFFDYKLKIRGRKLTLIGKTITPTEMKELFGESGIFLVPTRFDTQGVLRDEAMASGLVCLSSKVAAIPEYVDFGSECLEIDNNHPEKAAELITRLINDPVYYQEISQNAVQRIAKDRSLEIIIAFELQAMENLIQSRT